MQSECLSRAFGDQLINLSESVGNFCFLQQSTKSNVSLKGFSISFLAQKRYTSGYSCRLLAERSVLSALRGLRSISLHFCGTDSVETASPARQWDHSISIFENSGQQSQFKISLELQNSLNLRFSVLLLCREPTCSVELSGRSGKVLISVLLCFGGKRCWMFAEF